MKYKVLMYGPGRDPKTSQPSYSYEFEEDKVQPKLTQFREAGWKAEQIRVFRIDETEVRVLSGEQTVTLDTIYLGETLVEGR